MTTDKPNDRTTLDKLISVLLRAPWAEALDVLWKLARKMMQDRAGKGLYEVLGYESTLEPKDRMINACMPSSVYRPAGPP